MVFGDFLSEAAVSSSHREHERADDVPAVATAASQNVMVMMMPYTLCYEEHIFAYILNDRLVGIYTKIVGIC